MKVAAGAESVGRYSNVF